MRRRTSNAWLGGIVLLALMLVTGLLLLRLSGSPGENHRGTPTPWDRYAVAGDRLTVSFGGSPCDHASSTSVDETARRVVVTVAVRPSDRPCVAMAVLHQATVRLRSPLRSRPVYDGVCLQSSGIPDDATCRRSMQ